MLILNTIMLLIHQPFLNETFSGNQITTFLFINTIFVFFILYFFYVVTPQKYIGSADSLTFFYNWQHRFVLFRSVHLEPSPSLCSALLYHQLCNSFTTSLHWILALPVGTCNNFSFISFSQVYFSCSRSRYTTLLCRSFYTVDGLFFGRLKKNSYNVL